MKQKETEHVMIDVTIPLNMENVGYELCAAFEGGSNYWTNSGWKVVLCPLEGMERGSGRDWLYGWELPMKPGCSVTFTDLWGELGDRGQVYTLDLDAIKKGVEAYARECPRHVSNILGSYNGDADTGDAFLQCCLFGKVVFC